MRRDKGWWSVTCWLVGHELGESSADVEWEHDESGKPTGFYCTRKCGAFFTGGETDVWTGAIGVLLIGAGVGGAVGLVLGLPVLATAAGGASLFGFLDTLRA